MPLSRHLLIVTILSILLTSGCVSQTPQQTNQTEPPLPPPIPALPSEGNAVTTDSITGMTPHSTYTNFAQPETFTLPVEYTFSSTADTDTISLIITDDYIYRYAFISYSGQSWQQVDLTGSLSTHYITDSATATINIDADDFGLTSAGQTTTRNYIVTYTCDSTFQCHDGWQIRQFDASLEAGSVGLVSWWTFEGNADDDQGTNDGQLMDGAAIVNDPGMGNVLSLDGIDDYVTVPDSPSLDITDEITLSTWINLDSFGSSDKIIVKPTAGGTDPWEIYAIDLGSGGTVRFILSNGSLYSQGGWHSATSPNPITLNQWHHIAGTYDGSSMKLYIDGTLVTTNTVSLSIATNDEDLRIGSFLSSCFINGSIDDVMIYDTELSASDILDMYNQKAVNYTDNTTVEDYWSYRTPIEMTVPNMIPSPTVPDGTAWMHYVNGTYAGSSTPLYDPAVSRQNDGSGSIKLFHSGNGWPYYDRVISRNPIPVEYGKTYTFSLMTKTETWPPPVYYLGVSAVDSNNNWLSNSLISTGAFCSHSDTGVWEESAIFFRPTPGVEYVRVTIGMYYTTKVEGLDREAWFDDVYVGVERGFREPFTPKEAFNGTMTRVDDLGNIQVFKDGTWTPFFPIAIYGDGNNRADWSVYSEQGFNTNMWASRASTVNKGILATSDFNPDGMMSGLQIAQYTGTSGWAYNDTDDLISVIDELKAQGVMDDVLFYYWDNENNEQAWYVPERITSTLIENDVDSNGNRMHPIYQLNGQAGVAKKFKSDRAYMADITGNYVGSGDGSPGGGVNGFVLLDNYPKQRMPAVIAQMNLGIGIQFRPNLYAAIAHGAKGMGFWRDNYLVVEERVENRPWWDDLPNIRREIDALMPLIEQPHWTTWTVDASPDAEIEYGTRMLNGKGYIIAANFDASPAVVTFTTNGLPYTATSADDYFTGTQVSSISGSSFTVTLPAHGSGVYKLS